MVLFEPGAISMSNFEKYSNMMNLFNRWENIPYEAAKLTVTSEERYNVNSED